uniref:hypothetical protein n=1 Tax=Gracilaria pacifica TaxID=31471 RepID=UPI001D10C2E7|nr:hypothetical protein LK037_pgp096 [Gracilaria pacifica]UAD87009.1 hypothetical protein [Gracilaria pacifica]
MPLILLHLLVIINSLLSYNLKKIRCLNYYAMVSNNIYFQKTLHSIEFNRIQIKITPCNNYLLHKIRHCKYNKYNKKNCHFKDKSLEKYINVLKNSGCISSINKYTILYTKYKQTIFNVAIYPIINQITIREYKKLKIYPKFLHKLFKYQLGLPKNQLLLDYILHKINAWYLSHGYQWSNIKIKNISQANQLDLIINEGKIYSVRIECKNQQIKKNTNFMNCMILL